MAKKPKSKSKAKPKRPIGRPSKYRPEYAAQAKKLLERGLTDAELGDFFGVSTVTLRSWRAIHAEFLSASKRGKATADDLVERALFERATGYSHDDVHISTYEGAVTKTAIVKHYPPDVAAAFIWLKNRRPDAWRNEPMPGEGDAPPPVKVSIEVRDARRPGP